MITIHSSDKANMEIVGHLLDVQTPNVKFSGITFDCATITDADGNVFVRKRKGKWKETNDGWDGTYYVCSECGCPWTLIEGTPFDNGMNYCPNCGAKMEEEG